MPPTSRGQAPPFRSSAIGASAGGLEAFTQAPPGAAGRYRHGVRPGAAPGADARQRLGGDPVPRDPHAGHGGPRRAAGRAEPRLRDPAGPEHDHRPGHAASFSPREARGQQRPDRPVLPLAGGGPGGTRRSAWSCRARATDGTLGLEEIKAEGGITFAQDDTAQHDEHAAQRHRRRLRGLRAAPGRDRPRDRAHRPAPVRGAGIARAPDRARRADPQLRVLQLLRERHRRRLRALQVQHALPPHHAPHGPAQAGRAAGVRCSSCERTPAEVRGALPGHPDQRHQLLPRPGGVRGAQDARCFPRLLKDRAAPRPGALWVLGCSTGRGGLLPRHRLHGSAPKPRAAPCRCRSSPPT